MLDVQEWNLSRKEVGELIEQGLLTKEEVEECITSEFNPVRAGFYGGVDVWTRDVLNIGIRPDRIIAKVSPPFLSPLVPLRQGLQSTKIGCFLCALEF